MSMLGCSSARSVLMDACQVLTRQVFLQVPHSTSRIACTCNRPAGQVWPGTIRSVRDSSSSSSRVGRAASSLSFLYSGQIAVCSGMEPVVEEVGRLRAGISLLGTGRCDESRWARSRCTGKAKYGST